MECIHPWTVLHGKKDLSYTPMVITGSIVYNIHMKTCEALVVMLYNQVIAPMHGTICDRSGL